MSALMHTLDDFDMSDTARRMIEAALEEGESILVSGLSKSGKSTLYTALQKPKALVGHGELVDDEKAKYFLESVLNHCGHIAEIRSTGGLSLLYVHICAFRDLTREQGLMRMHAMQYKLLKNRRHPLGLHVEHQHNDTYRVIAQDLVLGHAA